MDTKQPDPVAHAARLLRGFAQELRETETLPPLHQWTGEDEAMARAAHDEYVAAADALEAWEISVGAPLRTGYDAARLEIKSLQARIQELGQMARDCNSRRVMELQAELVKESARTAAEKLRADQMAEQHRMQCEMSKADRAKVQELEAMLAAVGAGGMEPLRKTNSVEFDGIKTYHGQLLRAALQEAEAALEVALARILKRDPGHAVNVTSEAKALVIVRSALAESQTNHFRGATEMVQASAPVVLPAPDVFAKVSHKGAAKWDVEFTWPVGKFEEDGDHKLYTEQQVRALLATGGQAQAVPVANCYSDDDGDRWRDRPDDCEFVEGRALGEEFELQASIRSWTEVFRVTKVPDENSDDYEVEPVSMRTTSASQVQADAPVVLPAPVAAQSRFADTPSDTWESCSVEHARSFGGVGYEVRYLYTEQQVRAAIAAAKGE